MKKHFAYLIAPALLAACTKNEHATQNAAESEPITVETAIIQQREIPLVYDAEGIVFAKTETAVSAKITAEVEWSAIEIGKHVEKGEVLAKLAAREIDARFEAAEADLAKTERNLKRERGLLERGASTATHVKDLEDALKLNEARLAEAATYKSYANITAPISGVITSKNINVGDLASAGAILCEIADDATLQIKAALPVGMLAALDKNLSYKVLAGDKTAEAKIYEISPQADAKTQTKTVKFLLQKPNGFQMGQSVKIAMPIKSANALTIPAKCVSHFGQIARAFAVVNGKIEMRVLRLGAQLADGGYIVKSGISAGESVVVSPSANVKEGVEVK